MKPLSQNKRTYLQVVAHVNQQLTPEHRLDTNDALIMYDSEISPYGYPTHQSLLLSEGMSMYHFNREIAKNEIKDKEGNLVPGEGFGYRTKTIGCPNYYITDDLANSLIETKPPEDKLDLSLEILPVIKVIFSKNFTKINTIAISNLMVKDIVCCVIRENFSVKNF